MHTEALEGEIALAELTAKQRQVMDLLIQHKTSK
jgi:DNA-binding CsgD family transcriptional regulator